MRSKAEIIEALKCHMGGDCSECSYREGWHTCNPTPERGLFADILALLNKSDFEVVEEVLTRSKKRDWHGTGIWGEGYTIELLDVFDAPTIDFDGEGNIL